MYVVLNKNLAANMFISFELCHINHYNFGMSSSQQGKTTILVKNTFLIPLCHQHTGAGGVVERCSVASKVRESSGFASPKENCWCLESTSTIFWRHQQ